MKKIQIVLHHRWKIRISGWKDTGFRVITVSSNCKKRTEAILSDNIKLEEDNIAKEKELAQVRQESEVRKKQIYFLSGAANQNVTNLVGGFHTVYTLTDAIRGNIDFWEKNWRKGRMQVKKQF